MPSGRSTGNDKEHGQGNLQNWEICNLTSTRKQPPRMWIFPFQSKLTCWVDQNFLRNSKRWKHVHSRCLFWFWNQILDLSTENTEEHIAKKNNVHVRILIKVHFLYISNNILKYSNSNNTSNYWIIIKQGPSKMKVREEIFCLLESTNNFEVTPQEIRVWHLAVASTTQRWTSALMASPPMNHT